MVILRSTIDTMIQIKKMILKKHWIKLLIIILAIIIFVSSLFFVSIGIVSVELETSSDIEEFKANNATGKLQDNLYIYIDNNSFYAQDLRSILLKSLESQGVSTKLIFVLNETSLMNNSSFLGIYVTQESSSYVPWSGENKHMVFYYFSDKGNTQYYTDFKSAETDNENPLVILNSSNGSQFLGVGDFIIQGSFGGFFSKPKMNELTIEFIADLILDQLEKE